MEERVPVGFDLIVLNEVGKPCANPATKSIPVFKEIFARGRRGKGVSHEQAKVKAFKEFLYIYYMIDIRSFAVQRFPRLSEDLERHKLVIDILKFPKNWLPDTIIKEAGDFYEEHHVTSMVKMLKTGFAAINKTIDFLEDIDFNNKRYNPKIVMEYLEGLQNQKTRLESLMQEVVQDINLGGRPKGGGKVNIFENPNPTIVDNYTRMPTEI